MNKNRTRSGEKRDAVMYLRVSDKSQAKDGKTGFQRQEEDITRFAKGSGYNVVQVYREIVSGVKGKDERSVFQTMLEDLLTDGVDTIIVEGVDRLSRSVIESEQMILYAISKGLNLVSAATGENLTKAFNDDPTKRALIRMQAVFAEWEKDMIVVKLRKAREIKKRLTGKCEGQKAFGHYPGEELIVKKVALHRRATKGGGKPKSYKAIAELLNKEGFRTRSKKLWTGAYLYRLLGSRMKGKR